MASYDVDLTLGKNLSISEDVVYYDDRHLIPSLENYIHEIENTYVSDIPWLKVLHNRYLIPSLENNIYEVTASTWTAVPWVKILHNRYLIPSLENNIYKVTASTWTAVPWVKILHNRYLITLNGIDYGDIDHGDFVARPVLFWGAFNEAAPPAIGELIRDLGFIDGLMLLGRKDDDLKGHRGDLLVRELDDLIEMYIGLDSL